MLGPKPAISTAGNGSSGFAAAGLFGYQKKNDDDWVSLFLVFILS
jgi:hypothetical protein